MIPPRSWFTLPIATLLGLLLGGGALCGGALPPAEHTFRQWRTKDGLPNDEVTQVVQDPRGYLWVATTGGLARFDGSHFKAYAPGGNGPRETPAITAMAATRELGVVVALGTGGLWAEKSGEFYPLRQGQVLGKRNVLTLFAEDNGALWVACDDGTVLRVQAGTVQEFTVPRGLPGRRQIGFATDRHHRLWVVSDMTLLLYQNGALVPQALDATGTELRIASSQGDGPWLITEDRLLKYEGANFKEIVRLPPLLGSHYVQAVQEDRQGTLWLGTRSNGLQKISGGKITPHLEPGDDIYALTEDARGNLWVGTNGAGLDRCRPRTYRLYRKASGLLVDFSPTVCEDSTGHMWLANRDGGVVDLQEGGPRAHSPLPDWPTYSALSVFPLGRGIGFTCGAGVYQTDAAPGTPITKVTSVPLIPLVRYTFAARNGDVWFSINPDRIGRLRSEVFTNFGPTDGFKGEEIRSIAEDPAGNILVGTTNGTLLRFDGTRFSPVQAGSVAQGGALQSIYVEADGRIWLGTESGGVLALIDGQLRQCDARHGLTHNNITQILPDNLGNFWFGSPGGIFRLGRQNLLDCLEGRADSVHPVALGQDGGTDALACISQYQPGAWKDRGGRLWFATRQGVLSFDPTAEMDATETPLVEVESLRCDDGILRVTPQIELSANLRRLEIRFSALCLSTPERVQLKYRLDGFDRDWMDATREHLATYPRLPPGRYRLHYAAKLGDGALRESADTIDLVIAPLWWQSWWFRFAVAGLLVAAITLVVRAWAHRRLRMKLAQLEQESAVERERARIARDIHDDLGASLSRISLLTQSVRQDTPTQEPRLGQIHATVSEIIRSMDEIVWAVDPKHDNLDGLAEYLASYAQGYLSVANIRCRLDLPEQLPPTRVSSQQRHNLYLCLKEVLNNVVRHSGAGEVTIRLRLDGGKFTMSVADDGRGMDGTAQTAGAQAGQPRVSGGNGLKNLQRRMTELGGRCEWQSATGHGTAVTFTLALASAGA